MIGSITLKRLEKVCKNWKGKTGFGEIEIEEMPLKTDEILLATSESIRFL